jgi:hypothetical protein
MIELAETIFTRDSAVSVLAGIRGSNSRSSANAIGIRAGVTQGSEIYDWMVMYYLLKRFD